MKQLTSISMRIMEKADIERVWEIECNTYEYPWGREDFEHARRCRSSITLVILDDAGEVIGYLIYEVGKRHFDILNLTIAEEHQRKGLGTAAIERVKSRLRPGNRGKIVAYVWEGDLRSQLFLRSNGFMAFEKVTDHYYGDDENVGYRMEYYA